MKNKIITPVAELRHGWMLPTLLENDDKSWGRWQYWNTCVTQGVPNEPIPEISFGSGSSQASNTRKMIEKSLDAIPHYGGWQGWSSSTNFEYFTDWLLWSFGYGDSKPPKEPDEGAAIRLQAAFDLEQWQQFPYDYLGDIMAECKYGKGAGFFPTPMHVTELMSQITTNESSDKTSSVNDCAMGTGRTLLSASNRSLYLTGCEILPLMAKVTILNGYIMAPWLAKGIPQIESGHRIYVGNTLANEDFDPIDEITCRFVDPVVLHYRPYSPVVDLPGMATIAPLIGNPQQTQIPPAAQKFAEMFQNAIAFGLAMSMADRIDTPITDLELNWAVNYGPTFLANFPILMSLHEDKTGQAFSELCKVLAILKLSGKDVEAIMNGWLDPAASPLTRTH